MMSLTNKPLLRQEAVSALIPQKHPVVMVDTLWLNNETTTISGFTPPADTIFSENGFFTEPGIIEHIAQTAALRSGYMASLHTAAATTSSSPPVGYIAAIKNLIIHQLPLTGNVLKTEIVIKQVIFDISLIDAITTCNDELIASCEMKIFLKKD